MNGRLNKLLAVGVSLVFVLSLAPAASARTIQQVPTKNISLSVSHRRTQRLGNLAQAARKLLGASVSRNVPTVASRTFKKPATVTRPVAAASSSSSVARPSQPVASSASSAPTRTVSTITLSGDAAAVLKLVNAEREKEELGALVANGDLTEAAAAYAVDMKNREFFAHVDPDGNDPEDRIRDSGYLDAPCDCGYRYRVGENLAKGQKTAEEVVRDWMNSPAHRANIMNPYYEEIGIARNGDYWVQEFGRFDHE